MNARRRREHSSLVNSDHKHLPSTNHAYEVRAYLQHWRRSFSDGESLAESSSGSPVHGRCAGAVAVEQQYLGQWRRRLALQEPLEGVAEVTHTISVQERVERRVCVRQNDEHVEDPMRRVASGAERLDAVERVQREPADHEEEHDGKQGLGRANLALVLLTVVVEVQREAVGTVAVTVVAVAQVHAATLVVAVATFPSFLLVVTELPDVPVFQRCSVVAYIGRGVVVLLRLLVHLVVRSVVFDD